MMNSTNGELLARLNCLWHFMSAVDLKSIDELCRLCMSKEDGLVPIFYKSSRNLSYDLSNWILECTSVKVYDGDGLPSGICQDCHRQLRQWAEFRQRCQQINTTLIGCQDKLKLRTLEKEGSPDDDCISYKEERNHEEEGNGNESEELLDIPVEPIITMETNEEITCNDNEKLLQDCSEKNRILKKTTVLGSKQNSQMKENSKSPPKKQITKDNKCGEAFTTKVKLQEHETVHSKENPFQCTLCGRTFVKQKYLDLHMRYHSEDKTRTCDFCGRQFTSGTSFTIHLRVHTGERPYKCSECDKAFPHKKSLSKHAMTHRKEKPYECSVCKRGFSDKWHLKQHFRLHTGEKPYCCTLCGKNFTHNVSLREHLRHHTGEMWECDICPKKYSSKSSLTAHFRNVHRQ